MTAIIYFILLVVSITGENSCKAQDDPTDLMDRSRSARRISPDEIGVPKSPGFLIESVEKNSIHAKMGLKTGDLIKSWNGHRIFLPNDMETSDGNEEPTKQIRIVIERNEKELALNGDQTLSKRPFTGTIKGQFLMTSGCSQGSVCKSVSARIEIGQKNGHVRNVVHFK